MNQLIALTIWTFVSKVMALLFRFKSSSGSLLSIIRLKLICMTFEVLYGLATSRVFLIWFCFCLLTPLIQPNRIYLHFPNILSFSWAFAWLFLPSTMPFFQVSSLSWPGTTYLLRSVLYVTSRKTILFALENNYLYCVSITCTCFIVFIISQ